MVAGVGVDFRSHIARPHIGRRGPHSSTTSQLNLNRLGDDVPEHQSLGHVRGPISRVPRVVTLWRRPI